MDLQQLMRTMAEINKVFVPYDEAERRRENEIRTRFPNTQGPIGYDTSYIFGDDEYVETYDEYLRRTTGGSARQNLGDIYMGQPQRKDEQAMMRGLFEMMGLK